MFFSILHAWNCLVRLKCSCLFFFWGGSCAELQPVLCVHIRVCVCVLVQMHTSLAGWSSLPKLLFQGWGWLCLSLASSGNLPHGVLCARSPSCLPQDRRRLCALLPWIVTSMSSATGARLVFQSQQGQKARLGLTSSPPHTTGIPYCNPGSTVKLLHWLQQARNFSSFISTQTRGKSGPVFITGSLEEQKNVTQAISI